MSLFAQGCERLLILTGARFQNPTKILPENIRHGGCSNGAQGVTPSLSEWSGGLLLRMQSQGETEDATMVKDDRDILELLKDELVFIEQGGYGRSVRTPWKPKSPFQDSLTCINYGYPYRAHPCNECHLLDFVPGNHRCESVPCHFIPLNEAGETIEDFESIENQARLEANLKKWLAAKINELELARSSRSGEPLTELAGNRIVTAGTSG
jgi:hypothetical protein